MPDARAQHSLSRSIQRLAVDVVRDRERRVAGTGPMRMAEREEQFQIQVSGIATDMPGYVSAELEFETGFVIASGDRNSELQRPQVMMGYELTEVARINVEAGQVTQPPALGVILCAVIRDWKFTESLVMTGASVAVTAIAPGDEVSFRGFVHVTFEGYGAPTEPKPDTGG
jgi:hypothetical protein